jgi:MoaA/NifB/PqqE/SkfB family radical SAM enzyme
MEWGFFKSIVDRINFPTTVVLWLNGEPLLHPQYSEMAKYVSSKGIRWYITTNGHVRDEATFTHIVSKSSTCYQVLFSLDGLPSEKSKSIEITRPGSKRNFVLNTIEDFMSMNDMAGHPVDVGIKLCERGQDTEEIEEYIATWLAEGVDYVVIGRMLSQHNPQSLRIYPCRYFWDQAMEIRWDGTVIPCSYHLEVANNHALDMAQLDKETPLLDVYNNSRYQSLRQSHAQGIFPPPCDTCGFAYCGDGFDGVIRFRSSKLDSVVGGQQIFWHSDYYNQFFSFKKKRVGISYTRSWEDTIGKDCEAIKAGATIEGAQPWPPR